MVELVKLFAQTQPVRLIGRWKTIRIVLATKDAIYLNVLFVMSCLLAYSCNDK